MASESSISLIIPAYNEELRIAKTLQDVYSYLTDHYPDFELIVVDDGSTDKTAAIINDFVANRNGIRLVTNPVNRGKGYAVKRGVFISSGMIIAFSDADQSVPISELSKLIHLIEEGADIAIASRALEGSVIMKRQALWRQTMGKIFNAFVQHIAFNGIGDTQCGFKCFKREVALCLFGDQKIDGFAFDVEILYLAKLKKYVISQFPVIWINSANSKVNPLFDSLGMLKDLFMIKRLHKGD